jgi:predicted nucleic acid-binding protein
VSDGGARKYVLDTNLFIKGFRDPAANAELRGFHELFAPFEYLSAVVAQELLGGTRDPVDRGKLERHVLDVYTRRRRVVSPSARTWTLSGIVLAELVRREGLELHRVSKAFGNDVLLALSCRENGLVLVTDNTGDFERMSRITAFEFVRPWPIPRSTSG